MSITLESADDFEPKEKPQRKTIDFNVGRLTDVLLNRAKLQDDDTIYPAAWRQANNLPHGAELVTITKTEYAALQDANQTRVMLQSEYDKVSFWINEHLIRERNANSWPFNQPNAQGKSPTSCDMAVYIMTQWRYRGPLGLLRKFIHAWREFTGSNLSGKHGQGNGGGYGGQ